MGMYAPTYLCPCSSLGHLYIKLQFIPIPYPQLNIWGMRKGFGRMLGAHLYPLGMPISISWNFLGPQLSHLGIDGVPSRIPWNHSAPHFAGHAASNIVDPFKTRLFPFPGIPERQSSELSSAPVSQHGDPQFHLARITRGSNITIGNHRGPQIVSPRITRGPKMDCSSILGTLDV